MEKWAQLGEELDRMLKLRTPSLGVKLLKRIEDAPADVNPLDYTCAVC